VAPYGNAKLIIPAPTLPSKHVETWRNALINLTKKILYEMVVLILNM